ncbi:MAG: general secretion pathway protein GspF [Gammaproteobacteria bacterium]|jgi:hypothetical protein
MAKKPRPLSIDEPLRHPDHPRPVTRREFMRQGFLGASAMVTGGTLLKYLLQPQLAMANVLSIDPDISSLAPSECPFGVSGNGKIPFICFDLAGGANIAGSNVMVGGPGGQLDELTTAGYSKLGIGSGDLPGAGNIDSSLGLAFHSRSAMLAGIMSTLGAAAGGVDGFVIPAISNNDTNTNPHNPMYGIAQAGVTPNPGDGAKGSLLSLIGTVASTSGGSSMSPAGLIVPSLQPTKIASPNDDTALVSTGDMTSILTAPDVVRVTETIARISGAALDKHDFSNNPELKNLLTCAYTKSVDTTNKFATGSSALDPRQDPLITGDTTGGSGGSGGIFDPLGGLSANSAYSKTASVMKLVLNGFAGAGTITLGGYDYHTGERGTGEKRDLLAGQCIGACLAYAAAVQKPLMVYVFSDGSLFSNGTTDSGSVNVGNTTVNYDGKGVWTGDMSTTASTFSLIYKPGGGTPVLKTARNGNRQLGAFQPSGNVQKGFRTANGNPVIAADDVTALVYTILLNYMALHGEASPANFQACFKNANLGGFSQSLLDDLIMFQPIVSGPVTYT